MTSDVGDDIAVVGVGCRFPGADNVEEYWKVLVNGENHIKDIPNDRWNIEDFYDEDHSVPGKAYVKKAAVVKDYNEWDHKLYGINEMEAEFVDPQHRMVLDCVHMALEDAGIRRKDINGTKTAVYIGSMNSDYLNSVLDDKPAVNNYTAVGVHNSIISARVAFVYNLFGPAVTMDTACSSSLVTIHLGGQALKLGECDAVICGGVNSITDPSMFVFLSKAKMLSPTGQSQPFSAAANGYARGEGCGIVILKRLKDANRDGNKIWGVLKTGSNQDGRTATPITAPSGSQQLELLETLYTKYGVDSREIQVIEAHGTGTPIGDPIEINTLGQFFSKNKDSNTPDVFIGTVKSNIGHTEAAAGSAGLIKVLLMLKHGKVVPSLLDKQNVNPKIDFKKYGLDVPGDVKPWQRPSSGVRLACVNSFGFGGTNAHAIVFEHMTLPKDKTVSENMMENFPYIVILSAQDDASLIEQVQSMSLQLKRQEINMNELSYTSLCKRDLLNIRKAFAVKSQTQLIEQCEQFVKAPTTRQRVEKTKLAFVFCGVGTTWEGMCKFMMTIAIFRKTIDSIDTLLQPLTGWTLSEKLSSSNNDVLSDPLIGHISIFGCQVGLAKVWEAFGIAPDAIIGQSVGEVAAAYISGGLDLESAVRVIYYRSKYLSEVTGGAMAVVKNVDTQLVEDICKTTNGKLTIAVYNSPTSCTISGDKSAIDLVRSKLTNGLGAAGGVLVDLNVKCAYHSPYVKEAAEKASSFLNGLKGQTSTLPMISTVTGKEELPDLFSQESYWKKNTQQPVLFSNAIRNSFPSDNKIIFLEIGPGPVLGAHIRNIFKNETIPRVLPSMRKNNESGTLSTAICTLMEMGFDFSWDALIQKTSPISFPKYCFRATNIPYKAPRLTLKAQTKPIKRNTHLYVKAVIPNSPEESFTIDIDRLSTPFIYDHIVKGNVLVPGAFYADLGYSIGESVLNLQPKEVTVTLEFTKTAKIENDRAGKLSVSWYGKSKQKVHFRVKQNGKVVVHGKVGRFIQNGKLSPMFDLEKLRLSTMESEYKNLSSSCMYEELKHMGFNYGKSFRIMRGCITGNSGGVIDFMIPDEVLKDISKTTIHPCLLDGMLQSTLIAIDDDLKKIISQEGLILLPVAIEDILFYSKPESSHVIAYTIRTNTSILENSIKVHFNSMILNTDGTVIAEIRNFTTFSRRGSSFIPDELKYELTWSELDTPLEKRPMPRTLIVDISNNPQTRECFSQSNVEICSPKEYDITRETFGAFLESSVKSKWGTFFNVDTVVVLFGENDQSTICSNSTSPIYQTSRQNCLILVWLLRFLKVFENLNIFITTQNTQNLPTYVKDDTPNNLLACEVWGFIRSVQTEFVHSRITMIDLQPSLSQSFKTFSNLIVNFHKTIESKQTEYAIYKNRAFGLTFKKSELTAITPLTRSSSVGHTFEEFDISSSSRSTLKDLFMTPLDYTASKKDTRNGFVSLNIKSMFTHPSEFMAHTTSQHSGTPNEWQTADMGNVLGLEYAGYSCQTRGGKFYRCGSSVNHADVSDHNTWGVIALFPTKMRTIIEVPKECIVSLKELPFYHPGLMSHSMIFWAMVQLVPAKASVRILTDTEDYRYKSLLERMLCKMKSARVLDEQVDQKVDVIVLLCDTNSERLRTLKTAKQIICLKRRMSDTLHNLLSKRFNVTITEVDTRNVFSEKMVKPNLRKVVNWLKQNMDVKLTETIKCSSDTIEFSKLGLFNLDCKRSLAQLFKKDDIFITTGGLTGLGWQLTVLLAEIGVGRIATISRRNVNKESQLQIEDLQRKFGCTIICFQGDVCDLRSVENMVDCLNSEYGRGNIRGVLHGAGVLDSKMLIHLDSTHFETVMRPKILGAMNLHIATLSEQLDFFVMHSSITSYIGSPGQGNYGAANNFLDAFARWRRHHGLPGQTINWGALGVGMAAKKEFADNFVKRGHLLLSPTEIRSCFIQALLQNSTGIVYANIDWNTFSNDFFIPQMARVNKAMESFFLQKDIKPDTNTQKVTDKRVDIGQLKSSDRATQVKSIQDFVIATAKRVIGGDVGTLSVSSSFGQLGMDSMSAVTFSNVIHQETNVRVQQEIFLDLDKGIADVVDIIDGSLFGSSQGAQIKEKVHNFTTSQTVRF